MRKQNWVWKATLAAVLTGSLGAIAKITPEATFCAAQLSVVSADQAREIFSGKTERVIDLEIKRVEALRKTLQTTGVYGPALKNSDAYLAALKEIRNDKGPRGFTLDGSLLDGDDDLDGKPAKRVGGFVLGSAKLGVAKLGPGELVPAEPETPEDDSEFIPPQVTPNIALLKLGIDPKIGDFSRYLTPEKADRVPPEYFDPTIVKLPAGFERLFQFALADGLYGPRLADSIAQLDKAPQDLTAREKLIVMVQEPEIRRLLGEEAQALLVKREARTRAFLKQNPKAVFDIGSFGAGLHNQNGENYLRQKASQLVTITFEKFDTVASNFAQGSAFTLNSGSRAPDRLSLRQRFGEGDLNFLAGGAVQVHQFDNSSNPIATSFAVSQLINRALSDNPILFNAEASDFELESIINGEPIYVATLKDGMQVRVRAGIGAGLGVEGLPPLDGLEKAYQKAKAKVAGTGKLSTIAVYGDLFRFARDSNRPLSEVSEEDVAIIGAGDSGNAVARVFIRSNALPSEVFRRDSAAVRGPRSIAWYGQTCTTCELFLGEKRSFYYDIAKGYRNGQIVPEEKLAGFRELPDGRYELTNASGQKRVVRYIVFTTGFISNAIQYFSPVVGDGRSVTSGPNQFADNPEFFKDIIGYEPTLGSEGNPQAVILARQFILQDGTPSRLILVGPKAGNIVSEAEKKAIGENSVANANHNWRVWLANEALAQDLIENNPSGLKGDPAAKAPAPVVPLKLSRARGSDAGVELPVRVASRVFPAKPGDSILLPTRLLGAFDGINLAGVRSFSIIIGTVNGQTRIRTEPPMDAAQLETVATELVNDSALERLIQSAFQSGGTRTLRAEFSLDPSGVPMGMESEVTRIKTVDPILEDAVKNPIAPSISAELAAQVRQTLFDSKSRDGIRTGYKGESGYEKIAQDLFEGNMARAFDVLVAAVGKDELASRFKIERRFSGTLAQHSGLRKLVGENDINQDYYLQRSSAYRTQGLVKACAFFDGDPAKTYDAAIELLGEASVQRLGWYRFSGTLDQLVGLRSLVNKSSSQTFDISDTPSAYYVARSKAFGASGFVEVAKLFNGNMGEAYLAATEMYDEDQFVQAQLGWTSFNGSVEQYSIIRELVNKNTSRVAFEFNATPETYYLQRSEAYGPQGYSKMARALQLDMAATYDLSVQVYGEALVTDLLGWYRYGGNVTEHDALRNLVNKLGRGNSPAFNEVPDTSRIYGSSAYAATGLSAATEIFGGDFARTYDAALMIYGKSFVVERLKWYRIADVSKDQHDALRNRVNKLSNGSTKLEFNDQPSSTRISSSAAFGQDNYLAAAQEIFEGDLASTYDTAVGIYGAEFVAGLRWERIPALPAVPQPVPQPTPSAAKPAEPGPVAPIITALRKRLFANPGSTKPTFQNGLVGFEGLVNYAKNNTGGDMGLAVREIQENLNPQLIAELQWPTDLSITVAQVQAVRENLPSDSFFYSKFGYATKYRKGNGLVLVSKEIFKNDVGLTKRAVLLILGPTEFAKLDWE